MDSSSHRPPKPPAPAPGYRPAHEERLPHDLVKRLAALLRVDVDDII